MRRAGVLTSLLLTAALLCAMPGLMRMPVPDGRADDSLRPPKLRTLTVWLMPGDVGDRRLLGELCAAFEKQRRGVRVFLRVVTADEFTAENAVLPDAALFETGDILTPQFFVPLAGIDDPCGAYAGMQLAAPLWLAPNVLSVPQSWLTQSAQPAPRPDSLLAAATPVPLQSGSAFLSADELPWPMLLRNGALSPPEGVGWQQLLYACPLQQRPQLIGSVFQPPPSPTPASPPARLTRGVSPTPLPAVTSPARVETLAAHRSRVQSGEALAAGNLSPAVCDRVRFAALCRDSEDARAFLQFLLESRQSALSHSLIPTGTDAQPADPILRVLAQAYCFAPLPNAFVHSRQEILQLCADGFRRGEDPVRTLLGLR